MPDSSGYRHGYRVFIEQEVMTSLGQLKATQRRTVLNLVRRLSDEPFREDFTDRTNDGQRLQIMVEGGWALTFRADHALKEVLLLSLEQADG
jgi:hypothetical protein